ncbi:MAG: hypothetical protein ABJA81_03655 [Nocardioidaceae bacterium]
MAVLWWLVPPLVATCMAMVWAGWLGRERDDVRRDDSDAALSRMQKALSKPAPRKGTPVASSPLEPTHGVAIRGSARRPVSVAKDAR